MSNNGLQIKLSEMSEIFKKPVNPGPLATWKEKIAFRDARLLYRIRNPGPEFEYIGPAESAPQTTQQERDMIYKARLDKMTLEERIEHEKTIDEAVHACVSKHVVDMLGNPDL